MSGDFRPLESAARAERKRRQTIPARGIAVSKDRVRAPAGVRLATDKRHRRYTVLEVPPPSPHPGLSITGSLPVGRPLNRELRGGLAEGRTVSRLGADGAEEIG